MDALHERVKVTMNGRRQTISKFEAAMMQLSNQAAGGDQKAIQTICGRCSKAHKVMRRVNSLELFYRPEHRSAMGD